MSDFRLVDGSPDLVAGLWHPLYVEWRNYAINYVKRPIKLFLQEIELKLVGITLRMTQLNHWLTDLKFEWIKVVSTMRLDLLGVHLHDQ
jgi:hypothetical protein